MGSPSAMHCCKTTRRRCVAMAVERRHQGGGWGVKIWSQWVLRRWRGVSVLVTGSSSYGAMPPWLASRSGRRQQWWRAAREQKNSARVRGSSFYRAGCPRRRGGAHAKEARITARHGVRDGAMRLWFAGSAEAVCWSCCWAAALLGQVDTGGLCDLLWICS